MASSLSVDEAMQAVFEEFGAPEIAENEFTETMYAEQYGLPIQTANNVLTKAVKAGKLTRRKVRCNGRRVWGYRMVSANAESGTAGKKGTES